jgi:2-alkyl-3-oxoalkanoate reductase
VNALVTGASGFLGLYVAEQFAGRGDTVCTLCRRNDSRLDELGIETIHADLRDRRAVIEACRDVDVVFHVAGIAGMGGRWKDYYETNVLGTRNVVEGCLTHGVGRLVFTSSPSVTFDGHDQEGVDESTPYPKRWFSHYAHSKALAEQHVLASNGQKGLLTCSLRPHLMWGPRDRNLVPRILELARGGRLRRIGDGTNRIDTLYVENAATAHLLAADALRPGSPVAGQAYFISQGEPVNGWAWIDELLALAGLPPVRGSMSLRTAWAIGAVYEIAYRLLPLRGEPPMSRFMAAQLAKSHYFNISRARRDFGYEPKISMAEGMRRLAAAGITGPIRTAGPARTGGFLTQAQTR